MFRFRLQLAELMLLVALAAILIQFSLHVLDRELNYEELNAIELSPDGKLLARASNHGIAVFEVESRKLVMSSVERSNQLAFSPDSKYLAAGVGPIGPARLQVWDCATWLPVASNNSRIGFYHALEWSPDGTMLYDAGFDHLLEAWSFDGESLQPAWSQHSGDWVLSLSPSPDGEALAVGFRIEPTSTRVASFELFNALTGSPLPTFYDTGPASTDVVAFTSGGAELVSCQLQDNTVVF